MAMLEKRTIGNAADDNNTEATLVRYIYSNHLQSASLELDAEAKVISYEEYHPYGTTAYQAANEDIRACAKRYRYTGKERDDESGLYYHGARYYVPWLCRWCAVDPLESKYAGMSPYNYCLNNPVTNIDSDGRDVITFHYFSSAQHINENQSSLVAADNLAPNAVGLPQTVGVTSYGWVTVEKNDSKTNTYKIEKTHVDYFQDQAPIKTTTNIEVTRPDYNFDYNQNFYKALHDFRGALSSYYQEARTPGTPEGEVQALLTREYQYTKNKEIDEGVNALMLGVLEFAASELLLAKLLEGSGFVGKIIEEGAEGSSGVTLAHEGFGIEKASNDLISKVASKRNLLIAEEGSDELAYLNWQNAEGVAQGEFNTDILLRPNPSKVAVLEEFLHGTQNRLGIIQGTETINYAEWHVNDFMIRHSKMLGIGEADVELLKLQRQSYSEFLK